jgi:hypothetical protein
MIDGREPESGLTLDELAHENGAYSGWFTEFPPWPETHFRVEGGVMVCGLDHSGSLLL